MKTILAFCAFTAITLTSQATTYYVSNAGSDSNSGTSTSAPWLTVAKANAASLLPGDIVSFQAGGIWREQLLPKSGNSTSKITYNSYGSGNKPLFLGSLSANVSTMWGSVGSDLWGTATNSFPIEIGNLNFNNPSYIANSSFTVDTSSWSLYVNTNAGATFARNTSTFASAPAGCGITVTGQGSSTSDIQFKVSNLSLSFGKVYRLSMSAKASSAFTMALPMLIKQASPYTHYYSSTTPWSGAVTTSWTTLSMDFTSNTNANDVCLDFFLGNSIPNGATCYLDDIMLTELTDNPSMISNPSFTTDLTDWFFWKNTNATASNGRDTAVYDSVPASDGTYVTTKGTGSSDIQLFTKNLSITNGVVYRLSYQAKATAPFTMFQPSILKQVSPYTAYFSAASGFDGNISTNWATITVDFTANATASDAEIMFWLGNSIPNGVNFYIDDVNFKEVFAHPSVDTTLQNANVGFRKLNQTGTNSPAAQGDFWWDPVNLRVIMYSTSNPGSLYKTLECAQSRYQCLMVNQHYIAIDGLAFWNGAIDCVNMQYGCGNISVINCDIRFIGGGYVAGGAPPRFGNAFQLWDSVNDVTITDNYALNIWDAGISNQGGGTSTNYQYNLYYRYNTLLACQYSLELWDRPTGSVMHDVYFEDNVCRDAGTTFSYVQRPDPTRASHICLSTTDATTSNISIQGNVFDTSVVQLVWRVNGNINGIAAYVIDYNAYAQPSTGMVASWYGTNYLYSNWSGYQTASGKDAHSTLTTP